MAHEQFPVRPELLEGVLKIADVMNHYQVRYAVIGGLAAGYRTHPRATRDVDLLLNISQIVLPGVLDSLEKQGFEFDLYDVIREWTDHHMVVLSYRGIRVDWLKAVIPAYQHVLDHTTEETWLGHRVRVATAEGLILMKLLASRPQDWLDIENLVAAQQDRLDADWICKEWQTLANADDPRMVRFLDLVGRVDKVRRDGGANPPS